MSSLKKILILSAASAAVLSGVAYAGGPEVVPAAPACSVCIAPFTPFTYLGLSAGWAYSDWNSFIDSGWPSDADTNGFTAGGKLGFQFTDHFGIEGGGFVLPDSDQTLTGFRVPFTLSGTVNSWFAYGAATIRAVFPGDPFLHITGKVGGVYRHLDRSGNLYTGVDDGDYATVIFGGSIDYDLAAYNLPLALGVDYLYVPGSNDSFFTNTPFAINPDAAPAAQVVVGSLIFKLAV